MLPYTSLRINWTIFGVINILLENSGVRFFSPHFDLSKCVGQLVPTCVECKSVGLDPILVGITVRCQSDVVDLAAVQTREHAWCVTDRAGRLEALLRHGPNGVAVSASGHVPKQQNNRWRVACTRQRRNTRPWDHNINLLWLQLPSFPVKTQLKNKF